MIVWLSTEYLGTNLFFHKWWRHYSTVFKHSARLLSTQSFGFSFFHSLSPAVTGDFLSILRVLKFYQMWPDVDLFPFILLGIRWALSVWNSLSFSSSWTSIIFFNIFFLPTAPVLYLTHIYRSENFVMYFHTSLFSFKFSRFFLISHTQRVPRL